MLYWAISVGLVTSCIASYWNKQIVYFIVVILSIRQNIPMIDIENRRITFEKLELFFYLYQQIFGTLISQFGVNWLCEKHTKLIVVTTIFNLSFGSLGL